MKKFYEKPELKVVEFETEDVITTSTGDSISVNDGTNMDINNSGQDIDLPATNSQ